MPNPDAFLIDMQSLINRHSLENESDTPDFLLAAYLQRCLVLFGDIVRMRDTWYGQARHGQPVPVESADTDIATSEPPQHTYPLFSGPGTSWSLTEAWTIVDRLKPGVLTNDERDFLAGMIAGTLDRIRNKHEHTTPHEEPLHGQIS
jgi:hypothetical protein